jgi:non-homologous end joining protein Ku
MSENNMEEMLERYRQLAERYAPAKAKREYIDEYKKSLLALLMKKYEKQNFTSAVAQEREARADDDYIKLLGELEIAIHEEEKLRYHLKSVEIEIEVWRTQSANSRAERRAYGA